jgi:YfiH family protein
MKSQMFIQPDWPAPPWIKAYTTLRTGGTSPAPYNDFNLALDVGDKTEVVESNRVLLQQTLNLPTEPIWIKQIHSNIVIPALDENKHKQADASFSKNINQICAVLTADCLPVLLCDRQGSFVAAIHAGWRGLTNGIIEKTLFAIQPGNGQILAWLGPAISQKHFEVGDEVRDCFLQNDPSAASAFIPTKIGHWLCDLYTLARLQLKKIGISAIYGGEYCTFRDVDKFYSYRRDTRTTGRIASLIWRAN